MHFGNGDKPNTELDGPACGDLWHPGTDGVIVIVAGQRPGKLGQHPGYHVLIERVARVDHHRSVEQVDVWLGRERVSLRINRVVHRRVQLRACHVQRRLPRLCLHRTTDGNVTQIYAHTGFTHPGTYPKKPSVFFWAHPPKKPTPKKPTLLL